MQIDGPFDRHFETIDGLVGSRGTSGDREFACKIKYQLDFKRTITSAVTDPEQMIMNTLMIIIRDEGGVPVPGFQSLDVVVTIELLFHLLSQDLDMRFGIRMIP